MSSRPYGSSLSFSFLVFGLRVSRSRGHSWIHFLQTYTKILPDFLQSSYKTYKQDTSTVATWLATKAKQCGYPADILSRRDSASQSSTNALTSGRLKGAARKKAKEASKKASTPSTVRPPSGTPTQPICHHNQRFHYLGKVCHQFCETQHPCPGNVKGSVGSTNSPSAAAALQRSISGTTQDICRIHGL